jgi:hypothetical protein
LLWYYESLEEQLALVGPDPAPYSLEKMERTLGAFVAYGLEQGVFTKALSLEDLFWNDAA